MSKKIIQGYQPVSDRQTQEPPNPPTSGSDIHRSFIDDIEAKAYRDGYDEGWGRAKEIFGTHEILGGGLKRYVCLDDILKFPIREDHCDKKNGSQEFINGIETVFEYIECLPVFETDFDNVQNAYDKGWNDGFDFALYMDEGGVE